MRSRALSNAPWGPEKADTQPGSGRRSHHLLDKAGWNLGLCTLCQATSSSFLLWPGSQPMSGKKNAEELCHLSSLFNLAVPVFPAIRQDRGDAHYTPSSTWERVASGLLAAWHQAWGWQKLPCSSLPIRQPQSCSGQLRLMGSGRVGGSLGPGA